MFFYILLIGLELLAWRLWYRFLDHFTEKKEYDYVTLFKVVLWTKSILGIPITLIRMREPFIMKELFGKKKQNYSTQPLVCYLRKAMNMELVSLTLIGIDVFVHYQMEN